MPRPGATTLPLQIVRAPIGRREVDFPKGRRWRIKLQRDVVALAHVPRRLGHLTADTLFRPGMLEHDARVGGQALVHHHHGAVWVHTQRSHVESLCLSL